MIQLLATLQHLLRSLMPYTVSSDVGSFPVYETVPRFSDLTSTVISLTEAASTMQGS